MKKSDKLNSLIPLDEIDESAKKQIDNALENDFLKKLVIMPDVHTGYDLPIGGVALLEGVISPAYVGYDIGCGMTNVIVDITILEVLPDAREKINIFNKIYNQIPVGFNSRKKKIKERIVESFLMDQYPQNGVFESGSGDKKLTASVNEKLFFQLGTLGGGNHFIEIGADQEQQLAVTIHSGSRNLGHQIASFYMSKGKFLKTDSELGRAYIQDMNFALNFALANRKYMMEIVLKILGFDSVLIKNLFANRFINENHNHAEISANGILHRKGATPAKAGQLGVIPANMRDGVYITRGLGNKEFLESASHGAGRVLSRKKAKQTINMDDFTRTMQGIIAKVDRTTLDESPFSYKNIDSVIGYQQGIVVDVINKIKPLINIKG